MLLLANFYLIIHHSSKDNVRVRGRAWSGGGEGVAGKCFIIKTSTLDLVQSAALTIHLWGNGEGCRREGSSKMETCSGDHSSIALHHSTWCEKHSISWVSSFQLFAGPMLVWATLDKSPYLSKPQVSHLQYLAKYMNCVGLHVLKWDHSV